MSTVEASPPFEPATREKRGAGVGAGVLTALLAILSLGLGTGTYLAWRGSFGLEVAPSVVLVLSLGTFFFCLAFFAMAAWRIVKIAKARREGAAGARLHTRLTSLFLIVAVVPIITVAIFAVSTLTLGIETWFSDRVRNVLSNAQEVATFILEGQQDLLRDHLVAYAAEVDGVIELLEEDPDRLERFLSERAQSTYLFFGSFILDSDGTILAFAREERLKRIIPPPPEILARAASGGPVILEAREESLLWGLIKLEGRPDTFLYVVRPINAATADLARQTLEAQAQYELAEKSRWDIQFVFFMVFLALSFILLLGAIWLGISMAARIVAPISRLVTAAERVSEGDLSARVEVDRSDDELGMLGRAFNRMTGQLQTQRDELIEANRQYDRRRRFTEAVLAGVTAGVLGLDQRGVVTIANRSALTLLGRRLDDVIGRRLDALVKEMAPLLERALAEGEPSVEGEIEIAREGRTRHLIMRVTRESGITESHGHVVTFDDISNLVAAQRMSAWADVARRIAHEIKNPLTPIQLSAERLKRKYAREVVKDPDVFIQCTDTIIRQVGDLQRMVDEFSAFARMPAPTMGRNDLAEIVRQAVFLQRVANSEIEFHVEAPEGGLALVCDGRQVSQALINVLKNAGEAIEARRMAPAPEGFIGRIEVRVRLDEAMGEAIIDVIDNGCGLPKEDRYRLTEPYRTTRAKGTGLGLAIVSKILEDHGGRLELDDAPTGDATDGEAGHGAWIRLVLKIDRGMVHALDKTEKDDSREAVVTESEAHGG